MNDWEAPHGVESSPAGVSCNPTDARVKLKPISRISSPTDDQPPPRQKGEGVAIPALGQVRDGAGIGGRGREQLNSSIVPTSAAHHNLS